MTALTAPARPDEDAPLRPLPWRRMAWVTWRQHRIALAGVAALLGALAVWLWSTGTRIHHAYDAMAACRPVGSAACQDLVSAFNGTWQLMANPAILLLVVPGLTGAFAGAPVLARELETGTFRFAWTQGFDRWRWALAKLAALAVALAGAGAAFGALVSWCYQPFSDAASLAQLYLGKGGPYHNTPFALAFGLREVTFPAWTLVAFAAGALAGMLIRRVVPAIVTALAVYAGLAIAAAAFLREHYLTPLVTSNPNPPGSAWIIGQWWTKDGRFAFAGRIPSTIWNQFCNSPQSGKGGGPGPALPPGEWAAQCLGPHGYTMWTSYQPDSRFWPFQWIEGGWLLALSVLLIAAAVWLVRRRAT
jgi:hypothetical protein